MPITLEWIEPDPVLVYTFSGRITRNDLETLRSLEEAFFDRLAPDARLAVVLDLTDLHSVSAELFAPLQASRVVSDRRGRVVGVVGANPYLHALATSLGLIASQADFALYPTRAEALRPLGGQPVLPVAEGT